MAHARQHAAFFDDRRGRAVRRRRGRRRQELERDLAVEPRVPGAIDRAEGAAADALEDPQMPPLLGRSASSRAAGWTGATGERPRRALSCVEDGRSGSIGARFGRRPVDRRAVEDRGGEIGRSASSCHPLHLLGQAHQRALRRLARRLRRRLAQRLGHSS